MIATFALSLVLSYQSCFPLVKLRKVLQVFVDALQGTSSDCVDLAKLVALLVQLANESADILFDVNARSDKGTVDKGGEYDVATGKYLADSQTAADREVVPSLRSPKKPEDCSTTFPRAAYPKHSNVRVCSLIRPPTFRGFLEGTVSYILQTPLTHAVSAPLAGGGVLLVCAPGYIPHGLLCGGGEYLWCTRRGGQLGRCRDFLQLHRAKICGPSKRT